MGVKGWLGKDPKVRHPEWRGCRDGQVWSMFLDLLEAKATAETRTRDDTRTVMRDVVQRTGSSGTLKCGHREET